MTSRAPWRLHTTSLVVALEVAAAVALLLAPAGGHAEDNGVSPPRDILLPAMARLLPPGTWTAPERSAGARVGMPSRDVPPRRVAS